jgi:hypothetical protein
MDLLTGEPCAWGTDYDINARANELCATIMRFACHQDPNRDATVKRLEQAMKTSNQDEVDEARQALGDMDYLYRVKHTILKKPLLTELVTVLQHMDDARAQWEKAPVRVGNFVDHFGPVSFPKVEAAMRELGIVPRAGKGKNQVVAAFHAACEHYGLQTPSPGQWPNMLEATYPGTTWSAKCKPELRPTYRSKGYKEAFSAVKDRLQ